MTRRKSARSVLCQVRAFQAFIEPIDVQSRRHELLAQRNQRKRPPRARQQHPVYGRAHPWWS